MKPVRRKIIREEAVARRENMPQKEWQKKARQIQSKILRASFAKNADAIGLYVSMGREAATTLLLQAFLENNRRVYAPRILPERKMEFVQIRSSDDLEPGPMNIPQPLATLPGLGPENFKPDLMLMPVVAFDRIGNRLGYGGGYYDRFLAASERDYPLVGLAFECQCFPLIMPRPWDIPLDCICTETGCHFRKWEPKNRAPGKWRGRTP